MRIRRLGVPIAMAVGLVILVGATAGIIATRGQAPQSATPEVAVSPAALPLRAAKPRDQRQQPATDNDPLELKISGQVPVATREVAETVKRSAGADQAVEKNSAYTSGNSTLANEAIGGNIAKLSRHGWHAESATQSGTDGDNQVSHLPQKAQLKYPNLGSRLNDLAIQVEEGEASVQEASGGATVSGDRSFAVTVYLSGNVENVLGFIENNGGDPRNVGEDYIEAYVPVRLLGELSEQTGVLRVREILPLMQDGTAPVLD